MSKNAVTPADELEMIETEEGEAEVEEAPVFYAKDVAKALGLDPKSFRRWLRSHTTKRAADNGGRWEFSAEEMTELIAAYNSDDADEADAEEVSEEA
jgi:prophage antirepressor-like protein